MCSLPQATADTARHALHFKWGAEIPKVNCEDHCWIPSRFRRTFWLMLL